MVLSAHYLKEGAARMAWWGYLLLFLIATVTALIAPRALHRVRCQACRTALQAVRQLHPDWRVFYAVHRATEPTRDVVAVFYMPPTVLVKPGPYLLVAVDRDQQVENLPQDRNSPYAFHGRK